MPDHAGAPVSLRAASQHSAFYGLVDCMALVIGGHLLGDLLTIGFEDYEVLYEIEESGFFKNALDQHIQLRLALGRNLLSVYGPPGHEAGPV